MDGREDGVKLAIVAASEQLGPISIVVWHAPHSVPQIAGLRSDPAIIVLIGDDQSPEGATRASRLGHAISRTPAFAPTPSSNRRRPPTPSAPRSSSTIRQGAADLRGAVVYLASDASAAIEGAVVIASNEPNL